MPQQGESFVKRFLKEARVIGRFSQPKYRNSLRENGVTTQLIIIDNLIKLLYFFIWPIKRQRAGAVHIKQTKARDLNTRQDFGGQQMRGKESHEIMAVASSTVIFLLEVRTQIHKDKHRSKK